MFNLIKRLFNKDEEVELKKKELELKKRELELKEKEINLEENKQSNELKKTKNYTEEERKEWARKLQDNKQKKKERVNKLKEEKEVVGKVKISYKEKVQKGKDYEEFLANYFSDLGFQVDERGKRKGKEDKGIDLLIKKGGIYTLVQCKNFAPTTTINHSMIKEFNSNCLTFVDINNLDKEKVEFKFIVPYKKSFKNCAIKYFQENSNKCRYEIVKYND